MSDYSIVVAGHGRCGSSLVMQMLDKGGIITTGEYPAFEDEKYQGTGEKLPIGKAVKIIDPHEFMPPSGNIRWIWLDRDHKQQAKSTVKFMKAMTGFSLDGNAWKTIAASYSNDTKKCMEIIKNTGGKLLRLSFEDILESPIRQARKIENFIQGFDAVKGSQVVIKRNPKNFDGMLEIQLVNNQNN